MVAEAQNINMNLTVRIHDKEYKEEVAQGVTFSEEYNETLDSGTVRLTHVIEQIKDLKPYDDVYIYDSAYDFDNNISQWRIGGNLKDKPFYRHLLVDQFSEEIINLSENIFAYTIELFSETKGLEAVQCPNVSVTQPLNAKKRVDIYTYLVRFTNLYSPKYKTIDKDNAGCWVYTQKYRVAPELEEIFSGFYSQDFTLSNPNLRDILSTLMITKDMIPYVKDNVIYAKDISKRTKTTWGDDTYDISALKQAGMINRIVGQMSSADYCDGVRRQYSDALSSDGTCNFIEYLGFRNNGNAIMTLDNMCLNSTHKFYRINKCYMCYYKSGTIINNDTYGSRKIWFLCKQDISPLVKLQVEWDMLSQDWRDFSEPKTIEELSHYKLGTVSYNIGGTTINGWGTRYQEALTGPMFTVYDITKSYIENIFNVVDSSNPYGIYTPDEIKKEYIANMHKQKLLPGWIASQCTFVPDTGENAMFTYANIGQVQKFKTLFFEIEYEGFYDGALIHSRDKGRDNFYQNDNVSSSLTLLEKDGISQKEKLNRFANKTYVINGRLTGVNYDVENLLQLGNTGTIDNDDDVIIYRREYSIYNNYISVSYAGIQDYVLKNFYTNVYAKYRVNQLMSYNESINRSETRKVLLLLSKNKKYKDEKTFFKIIEISDNGEEERVESREFFSAFVDQNESADINNAIITVKSGKSYFVDEQTFTSGNNMCFNIAMPDNASGGNFIKRITTEYQLLNESPSDKKDYYIGSTQEWYDIVDDDETGAIEGFSFILENRTLTPLIAIDDKNKNQVTTVYNYSMSLPKNEMQISHKVQNKIAVEDEMLYKDNKDSINFTIQVEPISDLQNDIVFGDYFVKLSNLVFPYDNGKNATDKQIGTHKEIISSAYIVPFHIKGKEGEGVQDSAVFSIMHDDAQGLLDYLYANGEDASTETHLIKSASITVENGFYISSDNKNFAFYPTKVQYQFTGLNANVDRRPIAGSGVDIYLMGTGTYHAGDVTITYHQMWFQADGDDYKYYVAGFMPEESTQNGYIDYSVQETKQTVKKNMFVDFSSSKIDKTISYKILSANTDLVFSEVNIADVFSIIGNGDESILRVDVTNITTIDENGDIKILNDIKSINYWYFDFKAAYGKDYSGKNDIIYDYTPEKSAYYFVFGINLYPEDIREDGDKRYVDIYITKTTNRDERVFDGIGRQVGIIHNCVDKDGNYIAPTQQKYDTINNYPEGNIIITLQSAMGNHIKQWKCYQSEIIQPNFSIEEDEYKAKHGTSVKYWIDGSGKKHNDGYGMIVNNNETLTFYGEDWWKTLDPSQMQTSERYLSPTHIDDIYVGLPRSLPRTFNITGDVKAYPVTVKGAVELTIEYNGKTTSKLQDFSIELEEFNDKTEIPNPVLGIMTDDGDATSIFSLYYRKYTSDDDYKLVYQIRTTLTSADYEDKGTLTLKYGIAIDEIIQPYLLQD